MNKDDFQIKKPELKISSSSPLTPTRRESIASSTLGTTVQDGAIFEFEAFKQ